MWLMSFLHAGPYWIHLMKMFFSAIQSLKLEFWIGVKWREPRLQFREECYMENNYFLAKEHDMEQVWVPPLGISNVQNVKRRSSLR